MIEIVGLLYILCSFILLTMYFAGKSLKILENYQKKMQFQSIPLLEPLVDIPSDIAKKMSTDSKTALKILNAVNSDHLPPQVAALKIGVICHSR